MGEKIFRSGHHSSCNCRTCYSPDEELLSFHPDIVSQVLLDWGTLKRIETKYVTGQCQPSHLCVDGVPGNKTCPPSSGFSHPVFEFRSKPTLLKMQILKWVLYISVLKNKVCLCHLFARGHSNCTYTIVLRTIIFVFWMVLLIVSIDTSGVISHDQKYICFRVNLLSMQIESNKMISSLHMGFHYVSR